MKRSNCEESSSVEGLPAGVAEDEKKVGGGCRVEVGLSAVDTYYVGINSQLQYKDVGSMNTRRAEFIQLHHKVWLSM